MPFAENPLSFWPLLVAALLFDFLNGFHDSSNVISTMVASGAMEPRPALWLAALGEFSGPFLFGVAVARTIGAELIPPEAVTPATIVAALTGAILWNLTTWILRLPSSSSHALLGGLIGATAAQAGLRAIQAAGLVKILLALLLSPLVGILLGVLFLRLILFLSQWATPRINRLFRWAQIPASLALALSHGTNDGQKTMGIITMGLVAAGHLDRFEVPLWVIIISAGTIALGTLLGGLRIARTLGGKFYRIRPVHGFCAQAVATGTILGAALLGGPVSTTQVVSSAIIGAGAGERLSKVRWHVFEQILVTWLLTIPAAGLVAAGIALLLQRTDWW